MVAFLKAPAAKQAEAGSIANIDAARYDFELEQQRACSPLRSFCPYSTGHRPATELAKMLPRQVCTSDHGKLDRNPDFCLTYRPRQCGHGVLTGAVHRAVSIFLLCLAFQLICYTSADALGTDASGDMRTAQVSSACDAWLPDLMKVKSWRSHHLKCQDDITVVTQLSVDRCDRYWPSP